MYPAFAEARGRTKLFYWNLDGTVGLNGTTYFDDVLCMYTASKWPDIDKMTKINEFDAKGKSFKGSLASIYIMAAAAESLGSSFPQPN